MYRLIRALHLLLTAAVIPLGVLHYAPPSGAARLAVFVVGSVLAMFTILLDQADYPVTTGRALLRTGPLLLNLGAGFWAGGGDVLAAAHWSLTSLLAALALTLAVAGVLALRDPSLQKERGLVNGLVFPLSAAAAAVTVIIAWPLAAQLSPSIAALIGSFAWMGQTVSTTSAWMRQTVFSKAFQAEEAEKKRAAMHPWNGPAALATFAVMASLAFVLMFTLG